MLGPFLTPPRSDKDAWFAEWGKEFNADDADQAALNFCSDDCCTRNELLQRRVNILQHRIDTQ